MAISNSNKFYYIIRPLLPRILQLAFRKVVIRPDRILTQNIWPILKGSDQKPPKWQGWPGGKKFALILTHDVEEYEGCQVSKKLAEIEQKLGFRSAFFFVPERYNVSPSLREYLVKQGFEVGVHGLKHDGKLYFSERVFKNRAVHINRYLKKWQAVGFRSPSMHHNLEWLKILDIKYDSSTFDTDPFEPQPEGVSTIFPFWVKGNRSGNSYVELPYTLPQDSTLFLLLRERNIDIWKMKTDWIVENGGVLLLITHPDYMRFDKNDLRKNKYPSEYYIEFLKFIKNKYKDQYWHALPREVAQFWAENMDV